MPSPRDKKKTDAESALDSRRELNVLWTKSHGIISGYIRSVVIDFHRAEDVLQETAATVAEKFEDYDRSRAFAPWALGIAKNKVLESLRSSSRDRHVFDEEIVTQLSATFAELRHEASDVQVALERCLERVKGRSRKLLELRYLRGESAGAVASATGMTSSAVGVALYRIRKALQDCITQQLGKPLLVRSPSRGGQA